MPVTDKYRHRNQLGNQLSFDWLKTAQVSMVGVRDGRHALYRVEVT
jgi:hypothetical protein